MRNHTSSVVVFCAAALLAAPTTAHGHAGLRAEVTRLDASLRARPHDVELLLRRAEAQRRRARFAAAFADLRRALELRPADRRLALELGLLCAAIKLPRCAERSLSRFLAAGPEVFAALRARARARRDLGRRRLAVADYSRALRAARARPNLYLERGRLQIRLGDFDGAARGYAEGLARLGGSVVLRRALIAVQLRRRRYQEALRLVEPLLKRARVKTPWLLERARIHRAAGRARAAATDYAAALREANRVLGRRASSVHLVTRARVLLALGRARAARRDLLAALARSPRFEQARRLLARLPVEATR